VNSTPARGMEPGFVIILEYTVEGPEQQRQLVEGLAELGKQWVRFHPGFLSARFHVSTDGTRMVNFVNCASEGDYRNFLASSDTEGRIAAIEEVLAEEGMGAEVNLVAVNTDEEARRLRFPGSPTIRVEGEDLFPVSQREDWSLGCRVYATPEGLSGSPTAEMLREALKTKGTAGAERDL
jgi:C-6 monooxygenase